MNAKNQKPMQLQRRPTNLTPAQRKKNADFFSLLVSSLSNRLHKSKMGLMNELFNPLWNMSSQQAQMIYDYARSGNFAQLQYLYNEIENSDPTFLTCVTRRCSAMSTLDWRVVSADERPIRRKLDKLKDLENLRQEQIYCLEESLSKIDNIPDALDHFALSAFRGFSVVNTWHDYTGTPTHLECLDHWNLCFDKKNGVWLWNKDGVSYMNPSKDSKQMLEIPREDMVAVTRKRQIDWPAMKIFLRNAVGERDWGRFLETYGLPPVIITMPEFTSDKEKDAYLAAAESVFEGRSGVVPFGSRVDYASESRGTDPFSAFIEHQMKLFVLLSTGGTLTSLSEAGSGTLAGNAQMKVWEQIIFSDRRITANCINKQLCETILKKNFKGQPILAEFQLYAKPDFTPDELAELADKFSSAGFEMDAQELSQATGLKITKKVEPAEIPFNGQPGPTPDPDDQEPEVIEIPDAGTPRPIATNDGGNGDVIEIGESQIEEIAALPAPRPGDEPEKPGEGSHTPAAPSAQRANPERLDAASELARSLQQDFKGLADELVKIVALPEEERRKAAAELLAKVNDYVSDDPAMADVIYDQMKEAFGVQIEKHPDGDVPAANKAVPNAKHEPDLGKIQDRMEKDLLAEIRRVGKDHPCFVKAERDDNCMYAYLKADKDYTKDFDPDSPERVDFEGFRSKLEKYAEENGYEPGDYCFKADTKCMDGRDFMHFLAWTVKDGEIERRAAEE